MTCCDACAEITVARIATGGRNWNAEVVLQWNKHSRWLHYGVLPPSDLNFFFFFAYLFPVGLSETTDLDSSVLRADAVAASCGSVISS